MNLPTGYSRYSVNSIVSDYKFTTVAKSTKQAWNKFVAQCFRSEPMKPNPADYSIKKL